mmetsp:Transcript_17288/g.31930  ORF Transcript_17288/g.31930 Transcript_17288/m.31930 type:complete len:735 (-) Transcript_17288:75-2279(-)
MRDSSKNKNPWMTAGSTVLLLLLFLLASSRDDGIASAFTISPRKTGLDGSKFASSRFSAVNTRGHGTPSFVIGATTRKRQTFLQSTTEDQNQETISGQAEDSAVERALARQHREFDKLSSELSSPVLNNDNMVAYEVVDGESGDDYDITLTKEDFVLTNKRDLRNDATMKLLSSELGLENFLQKSDLKKPKNPSSILPNSSDLPLDVLLQRTLDTVEDVAVHLRRIPFEKGEQELTKEEAETRKTVVVLGSGWAAHALMKVVDCRKIRLIVVSPANHFVFTPMLASAAVGTVEYRSMTEAVRAANPMIDDYLEGKAIDVDIAKKMVTVKFNSLLDGVREGEPPQVELNYDHLIVSVGCKVDSKGVPGAEKALKLKSLDDARKLRQAIGECFEYSSRPDVAGDEHAEERMRRSTFLVVGGGPTGVEIAGELHDLAKDITRRDKGTYPNLNGNVRIIVAHSGPELVPQFDKSLRDEAVKALERKGIEVILNTRVTEVADGFARLSTKVFDEYGDVQGRDEFTLPVGLTVWCAGTSPIHFVDKLLGQLPEAARNRDGRIKVDKWMRPAMPDEKLMGSIFVLGDAAAFPEGDEHISRDSTLPQTAQVAGQQGAYIARLLNRGYELNMTPPVLSDLALSADENNVFYDPLLTQWLQLRGIAEANPFVFLNLGILAYLGGGESLAQVQVGDVPVFSYWGSVAFVLWRSVYLVKQVATRNRVLVTFDWLKSAVFGRDMTRF